MVLILNQFLLSSITEEFYSWNNPVLRGINCYSWWTLISLLKRKCFPTDCCPPLPFSLLAAWHHLKFASLTRSLQRLPQVVLTWLRHLSLCCRFVFWLQCLLAFFFPNVCFLRMCKWCSWRMVYQSQEDNKGNSVCSSKSLPLRKMKLKIRILKLPLNG